MTGSGTALDPYIIYDVTDLQAVANDLTAYYELANDIDASATSGWNGGLGFAPIGSSVFYFTGNFNGKDHIISGLFINRPLVDDVALFSYVQGTIRKVTLSNVNITGNSFVAALVADLLDPSVVYNCHSSGAIAGSSSIGGLLGLVAGDWNVANARVSVAFSDSSCSVNAVNSYVGGFCSEATYADFVKCHVTGSTAISGTNAQHIGGFVGNSSATTCLFCHASGNITCAADALDVGGFVGYHLSNGAGQAKENSIYKKCYATGNITGVNIWEVGGFAGNASAINSTTLEISDCYAWGNITTGAYGGGFAGVFGGSGSGATNILTRCYSVGLVNYTETPPEVYIGGFVGGGITYTGTTPTKCYWDTQTSGYATSDGGTGKTTAQMKAQNTFANWNFTNVWYITEGVTYPLLYVFTGGLHYADYSGDERVITGTFWVTTSMTNGNIAVKNTTLCWISDTCVFYDAGVYVAASGMDAGNMGVIDTELHYIDKLGDERYIQGVVAGTTAMTRGNIAVLS